MFAGIQALMDQGLADRGLPKNQGNAAPTLYALAERQYGGAGGPNAAGLATCSSDNGATGYRELRVPQHHPRLDLQQLL